MTLDLWLIAILFTYCVVLHRGQRALRREIDGERKRVERHEIYFVGLKKIFAFEFEE